MFTLFPRLPPELRAQIWKHALPSSDPARIYIYRPDCWELEDMIQYDFHPEKATQEVTTPLLHVNREARQETLSWSERHWFDITYHHNTKTFSFQREMDEDEILYVHVGDIEGFTDPETLFRDDLGWEYYTLFHISHIALPEMYFRHGWKHGIPLPFTFLSSSITIYVIRGEQPDDTGLWDLVPNGCGTVVWSPAENEFEIRGGQGGADEDILLQIIEGTTDNEGRLRWQFQNRWGDVIVELVPAVAVRIW
ncbi:hypothetical protein FLONG3_4273 [Fusarium longipes]|uniref:2EXR domain-containing protein n=1 Tax=Fusarium longipes TaxID=694270 RepID=A0A395SZT7_9HYPO|nr:hypothetical protein FLONG3_4273 [Fusarium longipes]